MSEAWTISQEDIGDECFEYVKASGGKVLILQLIQDAYVKHMQPAFVLDEEMLAMLEDDTADSTLDVLESELAESMLTVLASPTPTTERIPTQLSPAEPTLDESEEQIFKPQKQEYDTTNYQKSNSKVLGEQGERTVREMLSKEYDVQRISSTAHSTDIKVRRKNRLIDRMDAILLEIKNYSSPVPTREVEKFESDVDANKNHIAGAIMISLRSGITKKKDFEFVSGASSSSGSVANTNNTDIPIIYASVGSTNLIRMLVAIMYAHIDLRNFRHADEVGVSKREEKFKKYITSLGGALTNVAQTRRSLHEMQISLGTHMNVVTTKISETEYGLRALMNKMVMLAVPKAVIANNPDIWKNPELEVSAISKMVRDSNAGNCMGYNDEPDKIAHFLTKYASTSDDISICSGSIQLTNGNVHVTIDAYKTKLKMKIRATTIVSSLCEGKSYYQDGWLYMESKKFDDLILCRVLDYVGFREAE